MIVVGAELELVKKGVAAPEVRTDVHLRKDLAATDVNASHACAVLTTTAATQPGTRHASMNVQMTAQDAEITEKVVAARDLLMDAHRQTARDVMVVPAKAVFAPRMTTAARPSGTTSV